MTDNTNTSQREPDVEELIENVRSILGEPVIRNGEEMVKDPLSGEYFPVHLNDSQIQDIKSRIYYL